MRVATFRVINPATAELVKEYQLEYTDIKSLNADFHEARQVWSEYHVEADTPDFLLSHSHTWRDQISISPFAI